MMKERQRTIDVRSTVGVRNPYPLAEATLLRKGSIKTRIDWKELSVEDAKSYLYKAFHLSYSQLFDPNPKFKSPLYRGLPREWKGLKRGAREGKPSSGSGEEFLFSRRTRASPCTGNVSDWTTLPGWTWPGPPPSPTPGQFGVDAMQGCAADCYFIAALSSVAWANPARLTGKTVPGQPPMHKYKFSDAASGTANVRTLARPLAVDANGSLVFARPTDNIRVWPSLYEKAYAVIQRLQDPDKPDITQLDSGNPVTTLFEIAGSPVDARFVSSFDPRSLFDFINARCGTTETGGRTLCPMVTWTYFDSTRTPYGDLYIDDLIAQKVGGTEQGPLPGADFDFHARECQRLTAELERARDGSKLPDRPAARAALEDLLLRVRGV